MNPQQHLAQAIKDIQYIERFISGNEELISAGNAIMHIRKAMEQMRQGPTLVIEPPARRRERVSRFATERS